MHTWFIKIKLTDISIDNAFILFYMIFLSLLAFFWNSSIFLWYILRFNILDIFDYIMYNHLNNIYSKILHLTEVYFERKHQKTNSKRSNYYMYTVYLLFFMVVSVWFRTGKRKDRGLYLYFRTSKLVFLFVYFRIYGFFYFSLLFPEILL